MLIRISNWLFIFLKGEKKLEIITDKKELLNLVKKAKEGKIVLPQFQRNFVWPRDDIEDLLISITRGYYIGTFLLIRVDRENIPFQQRPLEGVEINLRNLNPEWMVLDGQQRLTALYYVFYAPNINLKGTKYPYRFYLNLSDLLNNKIAESIWSIRSDYSDGNEVEETQFDKLFIPFTKILEWDDWCSKYMKWLIDAGRNEELTFFVQDTKPKLDKWIKNIREIKIPTVELPKIDPDDEGGIGEVCAIFEKINSTGVKLTVFDLLTARLYKYSIDLHTLWEEAIQNNKLLNEFSGGESDLYGVYLLRTIALKRGLDAKGKTIIKLKKDNFIHDWLQATKYFEKTLKRLTSTNKSGFGVFDKKWLPYSSMIPILSALIWDIEENKRDSEAYDLLNKWYWSAVFLERYSGATESLTYRDYTDLTKLFDDDKFIPEIFKEVEENIIRNTSYSLLSVSRSNSVYKGVMCLLAKEGAKDFIKSDSIEFHELDDHHIFPKKYLEEIKTSNGKQKYSKSEINTIINKVLICSTTNQKIHKKDPSLYVKNLIPQNKKINIMNSQLINNKALLKLENNEFNEFKKERDKYIVKKIKYLMK